MQKAAFLPPFNLIPMMPSGTDFFTRLLRQVGYPAAIFCLPLTEPCGRGPDIHGPTQVPYYEMWVKIRASRTPQDAIFGTALIIAEPRPLVNRLPEQIEKKRIHRAQHEQRGHDDGDDADHQFLSVAAAFHKTFPP